MADNAVKKPSHHTNVCFVCHETWRRRKSLGGAGYSGHVDLILNGNCVSGSYTTPIGGVKSIRIWVLN